MYRYNGTLSKTVSGRTCQKWNTDKPHKKEEAFLGFAEDHNYCRNPEPSTQPWVWCYTTDPKVEWEFCPVPQCGEFLATFP